MAAAVSASSASTFNRVGSSGFMEANTINLSTSQFSSKGLYRLSFLSRVLEIKAQHKGIPSNGRLQV